ncbi:MAG: MFS transporter [Promethearchaeota archaeon]
MTETNIQVYSYRWIELILFMFVNITLQMLWISFAAVTIESTIYYGVDELLILLLSMSFMIVYIPITFLASWMIDKYEFKIGAGIGAILAAIFGFLRFFAFTNYTLVLIFQIGIGISQPFILNSITKLSSNWFPESERTTATGLSLISQFLGIAFGILITPILVPGNDLGLMLLIYGIIAIISGILFLIFAKDKPPSPPSELISSEKVFMSKGLKQLFTNKQFLILVIIFFIGLGTFNMITSYIELIIIPRGYGAGEAGILGGLMLLGGIIGAIVMSALSDKFKKRKILIIISILIAVISLFILSFTSDITLLYLSSFLLGFGILSAGPVALEFAVEQTRPVPESSSNGILMMIGQVGGILFILGLVDFTLNGDYFPALLLLAILMVAVLILVFFLIEKKRETN